jgi:hypothetical protein
VACRRFSSSGITPYCSSDIRATGGFELRARAIQIGLHLVGPLQRRFLALPDLFEIRVLTAHGRDLRLEIGEPPARGFVGFLAQGFAFDLELDKAAVEAIHFLGLRVDFDADARRGLVNEVDRLVRQLPVGDVAMRELGGGDDRRIGDFDAVMHGVFLLEPAQDRDRVLERGLVDEHFLEAPFERRVLFDVLAIFIERRRADAVQFTARERGFEHVAGVHRAFGLAGTDHRVQLVDEQDDLAFLLRQVVQHRFQALFELAAELGAGNQRTHVE